MLRIPRLDVARAWFHVMTRGLARRPILQAERALALHLIGWFWVPPCGEPREHARYYMFWQSRALKPETFLTTHRIFTREELAQSLQARRVAVTTVNSHLARWLRQGRIVSVKRGLFVRTEDGDAVRGVAPDYVALASRMAPDAALAYHTALEAHGVAQSTFERLTFATWMSTRALEFRGRRFVPVRPRAPLRDHGLGERWIERLDRAGLEVRVTTIERTVADVLDRLDLAGGAHEAWRSLAAVPSLDPLAIEAYVRILGSATLAAKVGFYLEAHLDSLVVPKETLERLEAATPRAPVFMDRALRGRLVRRWSLIVPEDLLPAEGEAPA